MSTRAASCFMSADLMHDRWRRRHRQRKGHRQTSTWRVLWGERSAHRLGKATREREPKPNPGCVVGVTESLERGEDAVAFLLGDTRTLVHDPYFDAIVVRACANDRWVLGSRIAQRVAEQVDEDALADRRISLDLRQRLRDVDPNVGALGAKIVQGVRDDLVEADGAREY